MVDLNGVTSTQFPVPVRKSQHLANPENRMWFIGNANWLLIINRVIHWCKRRSSGAKRPDDMGITLGGINKHVHYMHH